MKAVQSMFLTGALLLAAGLGATGGAELPVAATPYIYNYPHQVPADYVYRTGRIFSPPASRFASAPGPQAAAPNGAEGETFRLRIGALAVELLANAEEEIPDQYQLAVSTFVNLNNLYRTSALGRYLSEQLMGELQMARVEVIELRRAPSIMVSQGHGEYALSRDMGELAFVHAVQATLVGTYTVAAEQLLINARLLRNRDSKVLASAGVALPLDPLLKGLLADEAMPAGRASTVRIRAHHQTGTEAPK
jgi:TolB-like protein